MRGECDDSLLHSAQQGVLLTLVEAVNLIDEKECRLWLEEALSACRLNHLTHLLHACSNGREGVEWALEVVCH